MERILLILNNSQEVHDMTNEQKTNPNVVTVGGVNEVIDSARILLMMDLHTSAKDIPIAHTDTYLDRSITIGWDKKGERTIATNIGVCDVKDGEGADRHMFCVTALDLLALDEFINMPVTSRRSLNPIMLTKKLITGAEKRFRKFLKLEKEANDRANNEQTGREPKEMLSNLDAVKGLFFFMQHNQLIADYPKDKLFFVTIYNNCNKFNSATFTLSNSIKDQIVATATADKAEASSPVN